MNNILQKPYTNKQYAEFAAEANRLGKKIEITDGTVRMIDVPVNKNIRDIKEEIKAIEQNSLRAIRDFILYYDSSYLNNIELQISALRSELQQLD
jgi:hypothetical protein